MLRTYDLLLAHGQAGAPGPAYTPSYLIRHADCRHWMTDGGCIFEQCFDGRYAYLYYYEYWLTQGISISVQISKGDLHLIYTMRCDGEIRMGGGVSTPALHLREGRGAYYYLAKGMYTLYLPAGHHTLVGFILDPGLFRPPANRRFVFLSELVTATKQGYRCAFRSKEFRVGLFTVRYLQALFGKLNPYTLDNEHTLLRYLIFLINLSRFKLLDEDDSRPDRMDWVKQARQLIRLMILQQGAQAQLKDLAQALPIGLPQLRRMHYSRYGYTLRQYRNQLLLNLIRDTLPENELLAATAEQVGFSGLSEMNRFIRTQTGLTALQLKTQGGTGP